MAITTSYNWEQGSSLLLNDISSFAQHLLARRIDAAGLMLRDGTLSHLRIAAIAARAGFADISHFNRSFRAAFGDTPHGVRVRARRAEPGEAPVAPRCDGCPA